MLFSTLALAVALPFAMPQWTAPAFPDRDFNIVDYGAKEGVKCTAAFATAMKNCAAAGGGRVVVPKGVWTTGAIHLRSNCELHLAEGAVVSFTDDPADYLPAVRSSWEGLECVNFSPLVYAYGCTNVAITGRGELKPVMTRWSVFFKEGKTDIQKARGILYKWGSEDYPVEKRVMPTASDAIMRPQLIQFNRCRDILIDGVKIRDSPFWTIHLFLSENVIVRNVDSSAHGFNNDGIDIEMTRNVVVENCTFDQGDDGIVLKAGRNRDGWRLGRATENVVVTNCDFKFAHSLVGVGSELSGGVRNFYMADCRIAKTYRLVYFKTNPRRGGTIENIYVRDITAGEVRYSAIALASDVLYQWAEFPDYETRYTKFRGIDVRDVRIDSAEWLIDIRADAHEPARGLHFENLFLGTARKGLKRIENAEDVTLKNVRLADDGESICIDTGRQLFVDDFLIDSTNGVVRHWNRPTKVDDPVVWPGGGAAPKTVETPDPSGEPVNVTCALDGGLWWDPTVRKFRLWYLADWLGDICYAESPDGDKWNFPDLGVVPGTSRIFERDVVDTFSVVPDYAAANPYRDWKLHISEAGSKTRDVLWRSDDGVHFRQLEGGGFSGDRSTVYYDPFRREWVFSLRDYGRLLGRTRRLFTCPTFGGDACRWRWPWCETKAEIELPVAKDWLVATNRPNWQLYSFTAVAYESLMLGVMEVLYNTPRDNEDCERVGLPKRTALHFCFSRDGRKFVPRDEPDIEPSGWGSGKWDTGYLSAIGGVCVIRDERLYFYYSGLRGNRRRLAKGERFFRNGMYSNGSIGVATLRRDGFAGMVADGAGEIVTRPLVFSGGHLFINAECRFGEVAVEVLGEDMKPLPGYSVGDCRGVACGDSTRREITWTGGELAALAGRSVRFRFKLGCATLYSFWVSPSKRGESRGYVAAGGPDYPGLCDDNPDLVVRAKNAAEISSNRLAVCDADSNGDGCSEVRPGVEDGSIRRRGESRAGWMCGKYGVMVHWLYPETSDIDRYADAFDVESFLGDFDRTGADWLIFTIGQNRGAYASPSATLTGFVGEGHCARRDLLVEIARGVKRRGKRFIAYLPVEVRENAAVRSGLGWSASNARQTVFLERWSKVVQEWAERLGSDCDGWWFDGARDDIYPLGFDPEVLTTAVRKGNPNAAVAFNTGMNRFDGAFGSDFTAGETCFLSRAPKPSAIEVVADCQRHYLFPMDGYWGAYWPWPTWCDAPFAKTRPELCDNAALVALRERGEFPDPIYGKDELESFLKSVLECGAAVTVNVGIDETGRLNPKSVRLFPFASLHSQQ